MKRWIHATTSTQASLIPDACKKYYKIYTESDPEEDKQLTEEFGNDGLEFVAQLVAKSRYRQLLEYGEIEYVSLCRDKNGNYGVYVQTSYGTKNITDRVPYVIERVKEDYRY